MLAPDSAAVLLLLRRLGWPATTGDDILERGQLVKGLESLLALATLNCSVQRIGGRWRAVHSLWMRCSFDRAKSGRANAAQRLMHAAACCAFGPAPAAPLVCALQAQLTTPRLWELASSTAVHPSAMAALALAAAPPCRANGPLSTTAIRSQATAALSRPSRRRLEVTACARCLAAGRRPLVPALQQPSCRGPGSTAAVKEGTGPAQSQQQQQQQAAGGTAIEQQQQGAAQPAQAGEEQQKDSPGVRAALAALRFYKGAISPLLPPACRFLPTCSGEHSAGTAGTAARGVAPKPWAVQVLQTLPLQLAPASLPLRDHPTHPALHARPPPCLARSTPTLPCMLDLTQPLPPPPPPPVQSTPWRRSSATAWARALC